MNLKTLLKMCPLLYIFEALEEKILLVSIWNLYGKQKKKKKNPIFLLFKPYEKLITPPSQPFFLHHLFYTGYTKMHNTLAIPKEFST